MILQRLVEFAERQEDVIPAGYQERYVTKEIALNMDGELVGVIPLAGSSNGKKRGMPRLEPQETPRRTTKVKPRLFSDNAGYVLGLVKDKGNEYNAMQRHQAWIELVETAAKHMPDVKQVQSVAKWVRSGGPAKLRDDERIEDEDELTFSVENKFVTDLVEVQRYWASSSIEGELARCLVTGELGPVVERMPYPIKGIPGGQTSGNALISVNSSGGESYGLSASLNSPISEDAAAKICNGLNRLLRETMSLEEGKVRFRYALKMEKVILLCWCRQETSWNLLQLLERPDPGQVKEFVSSIHKMTPRAAPESTDFYVLALSANGARIIVRDYHETTLDALKLNLGKWFARLQLGGDDNPVRSPGIFWLAASLYRDKKDVPAHVPTSLTSSAIKGTPLPASLLNLAVKRNLAERGPFKSFSSQKSSESKRFFALERLALIKAILTEDPEDKTLNQLNTQNNNPAYHCGRLLAVLESIQRLSVSNLNATLTDRHYGAACASPASVFGNLLKDATAAHLPKIRKSRPGAYIALDQRLQSVTSAIGYEFPANLSLKDQAVFALGFYHQKAHDIAEARKNAALKDLDQGDLISEESPEEN